MTHSELFAKALVQLQSKSNQGNSDGCMEFFEELHGCGNGDARFRRTDKTITSNATS